MKIATIGKGNIGGGLGRLWEKAGHNVTMLGREGGGQRCGGKDPPHDQ